MLSGRAPASKMTNLKPKTPVTPMKPGSGKPKTPHVCVFDMGSDECLICGTSRGLVAQVPTGLRKIAEPMWKTVVTEIATKKSTSRRDWKHKPHYAKLTFVCVGCIATIIFLLSSVWTASESDRDECATGAHECDPNALCTNLDQTYTCDCDAGYTGDGWECVEIDECRAVVPGKAAPVPIVVVIPGSDGRERAGAPPPPPPPPPCIVWNDAEMQDGWQHDCINTPGSFVCECGKGWNGTWPFCEDVDECSNSTISPGGCGDPIYTDCVNEPGSWACEDVLECETDNGGCLPINRSTCVEQVGRIATCEDVNECETNFGGCPGGKYCVNQPFAPQLCELCDQVEFAVSVSCTSAGNSRALCEPGYYTYSRVQSGRNDGCIPCGRQAGCEESTPMLCLSISPTSRLACSGAQPGYCLVGAAVPSTSKTRRCEPVENADSVICAEPTKAELDNCYVNSRAQCSPGYYVTTCVPGYYQMTCSYGNQQRDAYGSDGSGMIVTTASGYYVDQPADTCTYCHDQIGCAVSYTDVCLTTGNTTYMACEVPEVDYYLIRDSSSISLHRSTSTTHQCTSQPNCVEDYPACLDTGPLADYEIWRRQLACAVAAPGYYLNGDGASATVTECTPVVNSDAVTCFEADNSRALCSSGYYVTDNSGMSCVGTDDGSALASCEGIWTDFACASVILDGTEDTCTGAGFCTYTPASPEVLESCSGSAEVCAQVDLGGNDPYIACTTADFSCSYTAAVAEGVETAEVCTATLMQCDQYQLFIDQRVESACPLGCAFTERVPVPCRDNAAVHPDGCAVEGGNCEFVSLEEGEMDTCALCTVSQPGCVVDTAGVCLAPGNSPYLACTATQPGYWLDGSLGVDYWLRGITTSRAVDLLWDPILDLWLPAPVPASFKSTGAAAASTLCEVVPNSDSVTCTAATNSRAVCTPSWYLVPAEASVQHYTSDACWACEPVANSDSITCVEMGNSRAVCSDGYYVTDYSADGTSDTCYQKLCDINNGDCDDACENLPGGRRQCSCTIQWLSVDGLPAGYELAADGTSCIDIDECYDGMNGGCGMFPLVTIPAGGGSTFHYQCINNIGAEPTCIDTLPVCGYEQDRDCDGTCFNPSEHLIQLGDGVCDDGTSPDRGRLNFDCPAWYRDNNDCCAYYPTTQTYVCSEYVSFSHSDTKPRPPITGRCSGNTDSSEDVVCSAGGTELLPTAATTVGDDEATCCHVPVPAG